MFFNPFLNDDAYDVVTQTQHCCVCETPLHRGADTVMQDHVMCSWRHYGLIEYPEILARDENGKTLEKVILHPKRVILALIPHQTGISFCLECAPEWKDSGCAICGDIVDVTKPHSVAETLQKYSDGMNKNYKVYMFHHDCLPPQFSEVRSYHDKYGPDK